MNNNQNENGKMQLYAPLVGAIISLAVAALYYFFWVDKTLSVLWCCIGAAQLIWFVIQLAKSPEVQEKGSQMAERYQKKRQPQKRRHQHKKKKR